MYLVECIHGYAFDTHSDTTSINVAASWSSDCPLMVRFSIDDGAPHPPVWRVSRSLIAAGLLSGEWVGEGDVRLRAPGSFVTMHFRPPGQHSVHVVVAREALDRLIATAERHMPDQGEAETELVLAALNRELQVRGLA